MREGSAPAAGPEDGCAIEFQWRVKRCSVPFTRREILDRWRQTTSVVIATEKARTAALTRRPSKMWEERVAAGRVSMLKMPGVLPVEGGLPILADGTCVGGIGVSGVQSHEDAQIGQAGIDALK